MCAPFVDRLSFFVLLTPYCIEHVLAFPHLAAISNKIIMVITIHIYCHIILDISWTEVYSTGT